MQAVLLRYEVTLQITLQNICSATEMQQQAILQIRNQDDIRKMMYTEHIISNTEHAKWINSLTGNTAKITFVILVNDKVVGLVSLNDIDYLHQKVDLGFYVDKAFRVISASVEFAIIDFVFNTLQLEKLNCEVLENNNNAIKMHLNLGFSNEGFRADNIKKEEGRIGVHYLGLTYKNWVEIRNNISKKYQIVFNKYRVFIDFSK